MSEPQHFPAAQRGRSARTGRPDRSAAEPRPSRMRRYAAVVCHPHPLFGGTMHNKVVYHAMKTFQGYGLPVLRFNFRGAGLSEGAHDNGHGEVDDVRAALDWLEREYHRPMLFAGFSFGSSVGLRACCGDQRVSGIAALGLPVSAGGTGVSLPLPRRLQPAQALYQRNGGSVWAPGGGGSRGSRRGSPGGAGAGSRAPTISSPANWSRCSWP